jgi:outer membrane protein with beta-barrel domain
MMKIVAAFALAMLGLSPLVASADGPWYIGAGAGESDFDIPGFNESATGWKVFGGYQFHDNFAAEVGYLESGDAEETEGLASLEVSADGVTASFVGSLPLGDMFSIYGRLGAIFWDARATLDDGAGTVTTGNDSGEDLYYGAGGAMNLGERAALRLEYEVADVSDLEVSMISLSVLYKF